MLATMKSTRKKPRQLTLYIYHLAHFTSKTDITIVVNSMRKTVMSVQPEIQFVITVINKRTSKKSA